MLWIDSCVVRRKSISRSFATQIVRPGTMGCTIAPLRSNTDKGLSMYSIRSGLSLGRIPSSVHSLSWQKQSLHRIRTAVAEGVSAPIGSSKAAWKTHKSIQYPSSILLCGHRVQKKSNLACQSSSNSSFSTSKGDDMSQQSDTLHSDGNPHHDSPYNSSQLPKAIVGRVMAAQANFVRIKVEGILEEEESHDHLGTEHEKVAKEENATELSTSINVSLPKDRLLCVVRALLKKIKRKVLVGDRVRVVGIDWADGRGMVEDVLPRNTKLDEPPVANITRVMLVFSISMPPFLPSAATKYLIAAEEAGIPISVVLNKCDLVEQQELEQELERLRSWGYNCLSVSVKDGTGLDDLEQVLQNDITVVAGPSGAGKSSIINALCLRSAPGVHDAADFVTTDMDTVDIDLQAVGDVSERIGRGKHTTRNVKIIELSEGGALVDTPGFNQPALRLPPSKLASCFPEIRKLLENNSGAPDRCAFANCRHISEPGCLVRASDWERYPMYADIFKELEALEELQAKRAASKRKREGNVRHKRTAGGAVRAEARLETKSHRRISRRSANQETAELTRDMSLLQDPDASTESL
eukprot:jgi/Picsp_1/1965/NSC_05431-R1_protein